MEHFDLGSAIEIIKHCGGFARPVMGIVGNVLSARQNALNAAQFREHDSEIARLSEDSKRTTEMVETLVVTIEDYERRQMLTEQMVRRQIEDPEFEQFVQLAVNASVASRLESKRHVFGRFVAKRLLADEEDEIVLLRRGMMLISDLVETQILALAGVVMIQNLAPPASPFPTRTAAERFAKLHFAGALERFIAKPWSQSDLDTLGSIGALGGGLRGNVAFWGDLGESSLDRWFRENGLTQDDLLADPEVGTNAARARYVQAYPTLNQLSQLAAGRLFDEAPVRIQEADLNRIDALNITPVGYVMGETILEQLVARTMPPTSD